MDARQQRGVLIAATCRLHRNDDGTWLVPSQTNAAAVGYVVDLDSKTCTCPDHQESKFICKHYYAASIVHQRDVLPDGSVIETKTVTLTERKTYKQVWPAYNYAQATEKRRVRVLLQDLCRKLPARERLESKRGPKPHHPADAVFAMAYMTYCRLSSRRFSTDLLEAHEAGFVSKPIPGTKVTAFFEDPYYTPILKELIAISATPLRAVEKDFAIDSTGFASTRYERWYDQKYGITRLKCVWVKAHIASGVRTNCITAVRILDKDAADCPQFIPLLKETRKGFEIGEVSADKAYASYDNFEEVAAMGGTLYAAFKENTTGGVGGMFEKMFHLFQFNKEEYQARYHKRSNVESTISAVKRKFGDAVASKTDTAQINEVLTKLLLQNLTVLIQEQETLGIAPVFWKDEPVEEGDEPAILPLVRAHRNSSTCNVFDS